MDKISRVLLLYSKLTRGEPVSKFSFCMETESSERAFDRDIEDVRIYLAESFSTEEVIYNRINNEYILSGVVKKNLEMTEYRFVENLIIQSKLLCKEELMGLLSVLASNASRPADCLRSIKKQIENYPELMLSPLLKMHDDINTMIEHQAIIKMKYHNVDDLIGSYEVLPYNIQIHEGQIYLRAYSIETDIPSTKYFRLERIESFEMKRRATSQEIERVNKLQLKSDEMNETSRTMITLSCTDDFNSIIENNYKDAVVDEEDGKVVVWCEAENFVNWIMGQEVEEYEIISPNAIKEEVSRRVTKLYNKYRKE